MVFPGRACAAISTAEILQGQSRSRVLLFGDYSCERTIHLDDECHPLVLGELPAVSSSRDTC